MISSVALMVEHNVTFLFNSAGSLRGCCSRLRKLYAYDRIVLYGLLGISGRVLPTSIDLPKLRYTKTLAYKMTKWLIDIVQNIYVLPLANE